MDSHKVSFDAINYHYECIDKIIEQNHPIISQLMPLDKFITSMRSLNTKLEEEEQIQTLNSMLSDINFENYEDKLKEACQMLMTLVYDGHCLRDPLEAIIKPLNENLWKLCETFVGDIYADVLTSTVQKLFVEVHALAHDLLRTYNHEDRKEVLTTCYHVLRHFLNYLIYHGDTQTTDFDTLSAKSSRKDKTSDKEYKAIEHFRLISSLSSHKIRYTFSAHAATLKKICDLYEEAYPDIKLCNGEVYDYTYQSLRKEAR